MDKADTPAKPRTWDSTPTWLEPDTQDSLDSLLSSVSLDTPVTAVRLG